MKQSKIHNLSKEDFQKLVYKCNSLSEILRNLNLYISSGNYRPLKRRLDDDNIDYSHIKLGLGANKGKKFISKNKIPLSEILIEKSTFSTTHLKIRLLEENIIENKCSKCGQEPFWNGEILVLQMDHINGNHRDNRLENLRMLCPNCHTQTSTYGSKNKTMKTMPIKYCLCGKQINKKATSCRSCAGKISHPNKINWPTEKDLLKMVSESNYTQVAKNLGVSDVAVRKRIKFLKKNF
jgi:Zn finger protein HypA/HybF involved in hydrogenase expression